MEPDPTPDTTPAAGPPANDLPADDAAELDEQLAATGDDWSSDLRALLAPGAGIGRRTADSVDRTLRGRSTATAALDLLGTGWHTLRLLLSDDPPPADGDVMGPGAPR